MKRAVFLDRDGVLNRSILVDGLPKPPHSIEDVEILSGVIEAIQILKANEFVPVVITNQPDVARGLTTKAQVEAINTFVGAAVNIDYFYTCFHDDINLCNCRKPQPGLIYRASREIELSMENSFLVGDRWRDISAGQAAGLRTFLIDYAYPEKQPQMPFIRVKSLLEATRIITERSNNERT